MTQEWISEFSPASEIEWKAQLLKELKGDESKLVVQNKIEEISYLTFHYPESKFSESDQSSYLPIQRGFNKLTNGWRNGIQISTENEQEANKKALDALMLGCDFIHFVSSGDTNWKVVLQGIGLPYIHSTFSLADSEDFQLLIQEIGSDQMSFCSFNFTEKSFRNSEIKDLIKENQYPVIQIDGFSINQCGANAIQELGFVIEKAHSAILNLLSLGLSIDQAAACIHFRMGVGSNYLVEIAKFRALKILWGNLVKAYGPEHNCSLNCQVTAEVGWVNKSLKDPHTNLLRQTTEAMSAILGGIDRLIIHPFDSCSQTGSSDFAQRMAFNVSNLLQDESYFSSVSDAFGGSYAVEAITNELATKSWELFKKMDVLSDDSKVQAWSQLVKEKANQRVEMLRNAEMTFIGINKFPNPNSVRAEWSTASSFLNLSYLRLETEINE
jgi:methylmalonyl-CoA mutase